MGPNIRWLHERGLRGETGPADWGVAAAPADFLQPPPIGWHGKEGSEETGGKGYIFSDMDPDEQGPSLETADASCPGW